MCTPKLWDIAAGVVIAEAAGAVVTDWDGGKLFPIDLDAYDGGAFRVAAANRKAHPHLIETMKR
jgi:fructose-1,6-bisphosphatase/inositol monophosphatase family enzyme